MRRTVGFGAVALTAGGGIETIDLKDTNGVMPEQLHLKNVGANVINFRVNDSGIDGTNDGVLTVSTAGRCRGSEITIRGSQLNTLYASSVSSTLRWYAI